MFLADNGAKGNGSITQPLEQVSSVLNAVRSSNTRLRFLAEYFQNWSLHWQEFLSILGTITDHYQGIAPLTPDAELNFTVSFVENAWAVSGRYPISWENARAMKEVLCIVYSKHRA